MRPPSSVCIQQRVFDGRTKRGGQQCNFYIHYEVDDDEVPTVLQPSLLPTEVRTRAAGCCWSRWRRRWMHDLWSSCLRFLEGRGGGIHRFLEGLGKSAYTVS